MRITRGALRGGFAGGILAFGVSNLITFVPSRQLEGSIWLTGLGVLAGALVGAGGEIIVVMWNWVWSR